MRCVHACLCACAPQPACGGSRGEGRPAHGSGHHRQWSAYLRCCSKEGGRSQEPGRASMP
eukprot:3944994-Alexandrium_andersonii.AAC.1